MTFSYQLIIFLNKLDRRIALSALKDLEFMNEYNNIIVMINSNKD